MPQSYARSPVLLVFALLAGAALLVAPGRAVGDPVKGPHVTFDRDSHDFGTAGQEQELKTSFTYRNDGDQAVQGLKALGDCGCYGVALSKESLEPGETGTLSVTFRTLMFSGTIKKRMRVTADNLPGWSVQILLQVDVAAGVIVDPGRLWYGDVLLGNKPAATVVARWRKDPEHKIHVTGVEVPGGDFDIQRKPYDTPDWEGESITIAFKTAPPLGIYSATALIRTDHPDYPRISLPLTANVTGKVWVQSRTVYFGWVVQGQTKSTVILVRPLDETVKLGTVRLKTRGDRVRAEMKDDERHPGWYRITVSVDPQAEPGTMDDVVEILTEVPGEEVTEIQVRGEVLKRGS